MNYRFAKITSFYRTFLDDFYLRKPETRNLNYEEQLNDLMKEAFGWSDFFKTHMENLGNEAYELIWNIGSLQQAWAKENNIKASGSDIIYHQLKKIKPDVIFFQDSVSFSPEFIKKIRRDIPEIKLIMGWLCSPSTETHLKAFREFDFSFGCSPEFTLYLLKNGIKSYELNHAFEDTLLKKISYPDVKREKDLIFIGSFIGSRDFHDERIALFEQLLQNGINANIHTALNEVPWLKMKSIQGGYILSQLLSKAGGENIKLNIPGIRKVAGLKEFPYNRRFSEKFKRAVRPPVYGLNMFREINKSKAGLNFHGGIAGNYAANSRLFEVTGMGTLLITDNKKNISDFFVPDKEIIIYKSFDECVEKTKWILEHPSELQRIAAAGQSRTLRDHTYQKRIEKLDSIIRKHLSNG